MDVLGNALSSALSNLFNSIPAVLGALVILLVFWIVGGILGALVARLLAKVQFDTILSKTGIDKFLANAGVNLTASKAVGGFIKWFIRLLGISAAVNALGLSQVSSFINEALAYLPNVLVAVVILMLGILLAQFAAKLVRGAIVTAKFPNVDLIEKLVYFSILFFVGLIVLDQLKVGSTIVMGLWAAVAGGMALALAIAVGLGGREVMRSYLMGRAIAQDLKAGMVVCLQSGETGRVIKVGVAYTTIGSNSGIIKVPNEQISGGSIKVLSDLSTPVRVLG